MNKISHVICQLVEYVFWEECLPELMKKLAKVKCNILDFDEVSSTFEGVLIGF